MLSVLGRVLVPVLTPFDSGGNLDKECLCGLIDWLIEYHNADSLIFGGTTGEFFAMSETERVELLEIAARIVDGRLPMAAGIGAASTAETIRIGRAAIEAGYRILMVVSPYYTKPNQLELEAHYHEVAEALSEAEIMLYNIPIFTGVNMESDLIGRLSAIDNIVGIKDEAEMNPKQITRFINATPDDFIIFNGDDTMILEAFAQGGAARIGGVVSGASHCFGRFIREMIDSFLAGDVEKAGSMQRALYPVLKIMGQNGRMNPAPLWKTGVKLCGGDAGLPKRPLSEATPEESVRISEVFKKFDEAWPGYLSLTE